MNLFRSESLRSGEPVKTDPVIAAAQATFPKTLELWSQTNAPSIEQRLIGPADRLAVHFGERAF